MLESTIQRVFTAPDWNQSTCDVCCDVKDVVLLSDQRVCHNCLLTAFDENGDPTVQESDLVWGNDYQQVAGRTALFLVILISAVVTSIAFGFYLAAVWMREVAR